MPYARSMTGWVAALWVFAMPGALAAGCNAGGGIHKTGGAGGASAESSGNASSNGGASGVGSFVGSSGAGGDAGRLPKCDDAGNCSCINIASIGLPAHYGAGNDNTDAFQTWLNSKSSAKLDLFVTQPTLTAAWLANYDVIILQAMEAAEYGPFWQFSPAEQAALATWVQNGGGLVTLTGYGGDADEVNPANQLLGFTGITYNKDDILGTCPGSAPCYCWGNSVPLGGWQSQSPISANIKQVGAFHGRSINNSGGQVVSTDGTTDYAVSKDVGKGKVFVYCDEWVTYTSQWYGTTPVTNMSDPCYGMSAEQVFQVPQFWYNVIKYASSNAACFVINDPAVVQ
jgi:hypothetical protein